MYCNICNPEKDKTYECVCNLLIEKGNCVYCLRYNNCTFLCKKSKKKRKSEYISVITSKKYKSEK